MKISNCKKVLIISLIIAVCIIAWSSYVFRVQPLVPKGVNISRIYMLNSDSVVVTEHFDEKEIIKVFNDVKCRRTSVFDAAFYQSAIPEDIHQWDVFIYTSNNEEYYLRLGDERPEYAINCCRKNGVVYKIENPYGVNAALMELYKNK